jgi:hypothetical protein
MSNLLLGIIAISVLVMAAIQVAVIVMAVRAMRRIGEVASRLEQDVRPIVANLQAVTADAARTTALAAATIERADRFVNDAAHRIEQVLGAVPALLESARDGFNVVAGLRAMLNTFRDLRGPSRRKSSSVEEEDPLFIG